MGIGLPDGPLGGLLLIALLSAIPSALVAALIHQDGIGRALRRWRDRLLRRPPPVRPVGLPIERIARNARHLRGELATLPADTPMARRLALSEAYDDLLAEACRALRVPDTLSAMPPGLERDSERLHVEHELAERGLLL